MATDFRLLIFIHPPSHPTLTPHHHTPLSHPPLTPSLTSHHHTLPSYPTITHPSYPIITHPTITPSPHTPPSHLTIIPHHHTPLTPHHHTLPSQNEAKAALKTAHTKYRMLGSDLHKVRSMAWGGGWQGEEEASMLYDIDILRIYQGYTKDILRIY